LVFSTNNLISMNVLHLLNDFLPATEGWIYPQVIGDSTWRSVVASIYHTNKETYPFPRVHSLEDSFPALIKKKPMRILLYRFPSVAAYWLRSKVKQRNIDIIHCHFGNMAYHFLPMKDYLGVPVVTMFYGYDATMLPVTYPVWKERYKKLFSKGDRFLVEGTCMKKTLVDLGCPDQKIAIFHLGIDTGGITYTERHFRKGDTLRILFAGAFRQKKGVPDAIEAFALAKREYPNMVLTIIGDASDADGMKEKSIILGSVARHNLSDSVVFLGFQPKDRLLGEFGKHHLFLSPSRVAENGDKEGGSPVVITEASASGLPVISTFHCDIPEVVLNGKTGLLSNEKDVEGLRESILFFIRNEEKLIEFGRSGRSHVESEYNLDVQLGRLRDIYETIVNKDVPSEQQ